MSKEFKMKPFKPLTIAAAVALLACTPAWALPGGSPAKPHAHGNPHSTTPGPGATLPAKAEAYGVYCSKESRKHVAGQKGTPFSQCVTAMAKLATGTTSNPAKACASMSKKHVHGQKGTPYSQCVSAAAKLKAAAH